MRTIACLIVSIVFLGTSYLSGQGYTSWMTGDSSDVTVSGIQGGIVLAGGGSDHDQAMTWMLERAAGGDVLVLRASGSDGYNDYFFSELGVTVNSVETIRFDNGNASTDPYVLRRIEEAEVLFFAGGDQYDYYTFFKDNEVEDLVHYLIHDKGITIGGTSAGMAILGEAYYTPSSLGVISEEALGNPYHPYMDVLGYGDFLEVPYLQKTVTDTHFDQRTRAGRFITFLARLTQDEGFRAKGIAANEYTAVCVDENGLARCFGEYPDYEEDQIYFAQVNCQAPIGPESCEPGNPLHWDRDQQAVKVYKIPATINGSNTFDLNDWMTGSGGSWQDWYVLDGELNQEDGAVEPDCAAFSSVSFVEDLVVTIFPNPVYDDQLFLEADGAVIESILLYSSSGLLLEEFRGNRRAFELTAYPAGTYWIRVISRTGATTLPVTIIR